MLTKILANLIAQIFPNRKEKQAAGKKMWPSYNA